MMTDEIQIRTDIYERERGGPPRGRAFWSFKLVTDRVTEKDHLYTTKTPMTYDAALADAIDLARRRRAYCVVVLP
jgi:hypothetical protein